MDMGVSECIVVRNPRESVLLARSRVHFVHVAKNCCCRLVVFRWGAEAVTFLRLLARAGAADVHATVRPCASAVAAPRAFAASLLSLPSTPLLLEPRLGMRCSKRVDAAEPTPGAWDRAQTGGKRPGKGVSLGKRLSVGCFLHVWVDFGTQGALLGLSRLLPA